ncbi:hypothetical protein WS81_20335 [Burkholderia sp. MSMB2040]|nr:hypothetical protein WS78_28645 [Burkholderia savannae]KVG45108.1 hypothetical protein WS77_08105 [Burkholderia sp. MSMB0265]KVG90098.1 hypothetical protein WS81_20335 [Burkholderia sp. MSMB2040]KVG96237.1 hypothetical protein WS82_03515 [Burkholderia sp. MSMB2041]
MALRQAGFAFRHREGAPSGTRTRFRVMGVGRRGRPIGQIGPIGPIGDGTMRVPGIGGRRVGRTRAGDVADRR